MSSYYFPEFEYAALVLVFYVVLQGMLRKVVKDQIFRSFHLCLFFTAATAFCDIISISSINHEKIGIFMIATEIYYLMQILTCIAFYQFVVATIELRRTFSHRYKLFMSIPFLIATYFVILNDKKAWLFYYDNTTQTYFHGRCIFIMFLAIFFYYFSALLLVWAEKHHYNASFRRAIYQTFVVLCACILIRHYFPHHKLIGFAFALCCLICAEALAEAPVKIDQKLGVPNRGYFELAAERLYHDEIQFSLILFRIADYELLDSSFGDERTRKLVTTVLSEVIKTFGETSVYKITRDTFAIITEDMQNIISYEKELSALFDRHWTINDADIAFAYFITHFDVPNQLKDIESLNATATYFSKMHRQRYGIVDVSELEIKDKHRERLVEAALKKAMHDHAFTIEYQPIHAVRSHKCVAAESLIRLENSEIGPISPAEFIPIAEATGLIIPIGDFIIQTVFAFVRDHDMDELGLEGIDVNLSTIQCLQRDFIPKIQKALDLYHINPKYIVFEITETASNCAPEIFIQNMVYLKNAGFRLAIDDFGTGYGNLERLMTSHYDIIKFDKNLTGRICRRPDLQATTTQLVEVFQSLGADIIAEGVETVEQLQYVKKCGATHIQGWYFSKSLKEREFVAYTKHN